MAQPGVLDNRTLQPAQLELPASSAEKAGQEGVKHWLSQWVDKSLGTLDTRLEHLLFYSAKLLPTSVYSGAPAASVIQASPQAAADIQTFNEHLTRVQTLDDFWHLLTRHLLPGFTNEPFNTCETPALLSWVNYREQALQVVKMQPGARTCSLKPVKPFGYQVPLTATGHPFVNALLQRDLHYTPGKAFEQDLWLTAWFAEVDNKHTAEGLPALSGLYTLPLVAGNRTVALLSIGCQGSPGQTQDLIKGLYSHRAVLAQALWNIQLRQQTPLAPEWNEMLPLLEPLLTALRLKDPYTYSHSQQVARLAEELACFMGLDLYEAQTLRVGALLHDVGKLAIADSILNKPGRLDANEWHIMKQHAEWGAQHVLASVEPLKPVLPSIRYHHEKWNGLGYPHGLKGTDIPFGARVVSVVDAYHAMTSDRPYRKALPVEKAFSILREEAGHQFDPMVVEAFLDSSSRGTFHAA